jgi:pyrimidine-nucleoside phosphorylase
MNPSQIIAKKRDGGELTREEIAAFVGAFTHDSGVKPEQMSALAMAIYLRGMTAVETAALVEVMLLSGATLMWPDELRVVDKHSTGGIGDKTSLPLAPILACCGLQVPMISGRGLGATGGTLDKLEAIPGFRTNLSLDELKNVVHTVGCVITGATADLVPADRKLYALRDVTATVASIPLITASIMSKKLAEGLDALVLDVKHGSGAFMKDLADARTLARSMVDVGKQMGVATTALLTDMNQPLGRMVGNGVEIDESVDVLRGHGPGDLVELTLALGSELLVAAGVAKSPALAVQMQREQIASGAALEKFAAMVRAQGGDLDAPRPRAPQSIVAAQHAGYVAAVDTEALGWAVIEMGGGRKVQSDRVDPTVGFEMQVRLGDELKSGDPLVTLFAPPAKRDQVAAMIQRAITIADQPPPPAALIVAELR